MLYILLYFLGGVIALATVVILNLKFKWYTQNDFDFDDELWVILSLGFLLWPISLLMIGGSLFIKYALPPFQNFLSKYFLPK